MAKTRISWFTMLTIRDVVTSQVLEHDYAGSGTQHDPYIVMFLEDDPRDPIRFPLWLRWILCIAAGYVTFSVAFISSAFSGSIRNISEDLDVSPESATLGLSLFLLGFVLGPLLWAPCSELYGRQIILLSTTAVHVGLNIAACFSPTLAILLVLRLLSGAFGAATLTNSGAVIADIFPPRERGLAITVYALVPLFAPVLGPMVGTYVSGIWGWRWSMALMALLSVTALGVAALVLPETYAPFLLAGRARRLTKMTGRHFLSAMATAGGGKRGQRPSFATTLSRPFLLAANEPILSLLALYQAVVFGTLYFMFAALPLVYTDILGWPREQSGFSFLGVVVGMSLSVVFAIWDNARYVRTVERLKGEAAPPETRLPACCLGGVCIVVGLLWCAWTARPGLPWLLNMASGVPFGFGIVLVTIGSTNYLVDAYTIYAASALTVCICGRAIWGAVFPLFVRSMFASIGVWWSLAIPAVLSFVCLPFPFVFYRFGPAIRARCRYAGEAHRAAQRARRGVDESTPLLV
ncbi:major facilitator superfamily domain-containing protein [Parachaetomium inaequale]|uniref:Major facilitator superfamily domain-containing protein n=1 Tax=Parachaetomium inaequale TaxID=2588326 RepID=A0AAN6PS58_9PEZI|nr:major facilitator superfamily domain-containing protein [Parachaetomium inaequale]